MAPSWKTYTKEIYRRIHYLATWPPTRKLEVGDIVVFEGRSPERRLSLSELGCDFEVRSEPDLRNRGWATKRSISVQPGVGASVPVHPGLKLGGALRLTFERRHGFVLRVERSREQTMERLDRIDNEILRLHQAGEWQRDWRLVTHVVHAEKMMMLLSEDRDVSADLSVSAGIGADALSLARAEGDVELVRKGDGLDYEFGDNTTPLYLARRVKRFLGRGTKQVGKRGRARSGLGEFGVFEEEF